MPYIKISNFYCTDANVMGMVFGEARDMEPGGRYSGLKSLSGCTAGRSRAVTKSARRVNSETDMSCM